MANRFAQSSTEYVYEMSPSLSPHELMSVKKSLLQHCGFMTDKTLLNDLLCSLDKKLQAHRAHDSYPIAGSMNEVSSKFSPRVLDDRNTLYVPDQNRHSLTTQPSEVLHSFPSQEHGQLVWTPSKVRKMNAFDSQSFQKRLSSTPTSKVFSLPPEGGSKPAVVRSLLDSLSFSEISSPQSGFASPLRVFSTNENHLEKVSASEEPYLQEAYVSEVEAAKDHASDKSHFKILNRDGVKPTLSDHLLGSDSVLQNPQLVSQLIRGLEANHIHEATGSNARYDSKMCGAQNGEVATTPFQNHKPSGDVPSLATSSKQVTFISRPDILSSSLADISEVSECCTVDSQATLSGPSLVSEVAKTDLSLDYFKGDSIIESKIRPSIAPTSSTTSDVDAGGCNREVSNENRESEGQCPQQAVIQQNVSHGSESWAQRPSDVTETMKNSKQLFCGNKISSEASLEKSLLISAQDSQLPNLCAKVSGRASREAEGCASTPETSRTLKYTSSPESQGSLSSEGFHEDRTVVNTAGAPLITEVCDTAETPKKLSEFNTDVFGIPASEGLLSTGTTHRSNGARDTEHPCWSASSLQIGMDYEDTHHGKGTSKATDVVDICERGNESELVTALQREKERCQFLIENLVKMEERCLLAEREKKDALAAAAELEKNLKILLDQHCCCISENFAEVGMACANPDFSPVYPLAFDGRGVDGRIPDFDPGLIHAPRISSCTSSRPSARNSGNDEFSKNFVPTSRNPDTVYNAENLLFNGVDVRFHQHESGCSNDGERCEDTLFDGVRLELPEKAGVAFMGEIFSDESSHLKCSRSPDTGTLNNNPELETLYNNYTLRLSRDQSPYKMSEKSKQFEVKVTTEIEGLTTESRNKILEVSRALTSDSLEMVHSTRLNNNSNKALNCSATISGNCNLTPSDPAHDRTITTTAVMSSDSASKHHSSVGCSSLIPDASVQISANPTSDKVTESRDFAVPLGLASSDSDSDSDPGSPSSSCYYDFSNNDGNETVRGKHNARSDGNHDGNSYLIDGRNDSNEDDHEAVFVSQKECVKTKDRFGNREIWDFSREFECDNTAFRNKLTSVNYSNEIPAHLNEPVVLCGLTPANEADGGADNPTGRRNDVPCGVYELEHRGGDPGSQKEGDEVSPPDETESLTLAPNFRLQLFKCPNLEANEKMVTERSVKTPSSVKFSEETSKSLPCTLNGAVPCVSLEAPIVIEKLLQTIRPFGAEDCRLATAVRESEIKNHEKDHEVHRSRLTSSFSDRPALVSAVGVPSERGSLPFPASAVVPPDDAQFRSTSSFSIVRPGTVFPQPGTATGTSHVPAALATPKSNATGSTVGSTREVQGPLKKVTAGGPQKWVGAGSGTAKAASASKILQALDEEKAVLLEELRKLNVSDSSSLHSSPHPRMELNELALHPREDAFQYFGGNSKPTALEVEVHGGAAALPSTTCAHGDHGTARLALCYSFFSDAPTKDTTDRDEL